MTTAPFPAISACGKRHTRQPTLAQPMPGFHSPEPAQRPTDLVRATLKFLRSAETRQPAREALNAELLTPALIVARELNHRDPTFSQENKTITGIEAHMLNAGLTLLRKTLVHREGKEMISALRGEIHAQGNDILGKMRSHSRQTGNRHAADFKDDVAKANAPIRRRLDEIRRMNDGRGCVKDFALDCIENALRTKPWAKGAYRQGPCHPLDDVVHSDRQRWLTHCAHMGKVRAADLGSAEARFILQSFQEALDRPNAQAMDGVRITASNVPINMRAKTLDNCLLRCLDTRLARENSRDTLIQLLVAAGARADVVNRFELGQELTRENVLDAIGMTIGARAAPDLSRALNARKIVVHKQGRRDRLGSGSFGKVFTGTMRGRDIAYKEYPRPRKVLLDQAHSHTPPRPSMADASYARKLEHLVVPDGYLVNAPHPTGKDDVAGIKFIERQRLRAFLKQQSYAASIRKQDQRIEVLADVQPLVLGETLEAIRANPEHRLTPTARAAMLRQGIATLKELHMNGLVHGDIKPQNMMWGNDGILRLIDVDHIRKHHTDPLNAGGLGRTMTPAYSTPYAALHWASSGSAGLAKAEKNTAVAQDYFGMAISLLLMQLPASMAKNADALLDESERIFTSIQSASDPNIANERARAGANAIASKLEGLRNAYRWKVPRPKFLDRIDFLVELAKAAVLADWSDARDTLSAPTSIQASLDKLLKDPRFKRFAPR